ncbi:recombinase family protein [Desulfosporosinus orientis]|uniref:recombinase family protein n=1 Tax=Desulfosporosinus orientis TaxID=1563 RepID=UPI0013053A20
MVEGDIIYVADLTRITRSTQDLFELIDNIRKLQMCLGPHYIENKFHIEVELYA